MAEAKRSQTDRLLCRDYPEDHPLRQVWAMRLLATAPLALYPLGGVILLLDVDPQYLFARFSVLEAVGFGLIIAALISFSLIASSRLTRSTQGAITAAALDERELALRRRAQSIAYQIFVVLSLVTLLYLGLAFDSERLWRPAEWSHWSALLWGGIVYGMLLPTAAAAWLTKPLDPE